MAGWVGSRWDEQPMAELLREEGAVPTSEPKGEKPFSYLLSAVLRLSSGGWEAGSLGKVSAPLPQRAGERGAPWGLARARRRLPGQAAPRRAAAAKRARPLPGESSAAGLVSAPPRAPAGRSVTKRACRREGRGGGERKGGRSRPPPPPPSPAREEEQFVYLGLLEAVPPPSSPRPPGPSSRPARPLSLDGAILPSPAGSTFLLLLLPCLTASLPPPPSLFPSLLERGRGGGSGRFVRLAPGSASGPPAGRGAAPATPPHPRSPARAEPRAAWAGRKNPSP